MSDAGRASVEAGSEAIDLTIHIAGTGAPETEVEGVSDVGGPSQDLRRSGAVGITIQQASRVPLSEVLLDPTGGPDVTKGGSPSIVVHDSEVPAVTGVQDISDEVLVSERLVTAPLIVSEVFDSVDFQKSIDQGGTDATGATEIVMISDVPVDSVDAPSGELLSLNGYYSEPGDMTKNIHPQTGTPVESADAFKTVVVDSELIATEVGVSEDLAPSKGASVSSVMRITRVKIGTRAARYSWRLRNTGADLTSKVGDSGTADLTADVHVTEEVNSFDFGISINGKPTAGAGTTRKFMGTSVGPTEVVSPSGDAAQSRMRVSDVVKRSVTTRGTRRAVPTIRGGATKSLKETDGSDVTRIITVSSNGRPTGPVKGSVAYHTRVRAATAKVPSGIISKSSRLDGTSDATATGGLTDSHTVNSEHPEPSEGPVRTRVGSPTEQPVMATFMRAVTDTQYRTALRDSISAANSEIFVTELLWATSSVRNSELRATYAEADQTMWLPTLLRRPTGRLSQSKTFSRSPIPTFFRWATPSATARATLSPVGTNFETAFATVTASFDEAAANRLNFASQYWSIWVAIGLAALVAAILVIIYFVRHRESTTSTGKGPMETNIRFVDPKAVDATCIEDSEMTYTSQANPIFLPDASDSDLSQIYCDDSDLDVMKPAPPCSDDESDVETNEIWSTVTLLTQRLNAAPDSEFISPLPADDEQLHLDECDEQAEEDKGQECDEDEASRYGTTYSSALGNYENVFDETSVF